MQVVDKDGVHSCLPTSLLNGLIHLGSMTREQAQAFQDTFKTTNKDIFSSRKFGESTLAVMAIPTSTFLERLKCVTGADFKYSVIGVKQLTNEELLSLLQQRLSENELIVGGDQDHAVLMIGFDRQSNVLKIIDPYMPTQSSNVPDLSFAADIRSGEPWLTVVSK
ncbi:MAG: hypothetical protein M3Q81_00345 [bacterium]|nr:hypothetical protein [bacterium]